MTTAFEHPVTLTILIGALALLLFGTAFTLILGITGRGTPALRQELRHRIASWFVLLPLMFAPVLAGRLWTIAAVTALSFACLREFDRATGLFREHAIVAIVAVGVLLVNFAAVDHWYGLFVALWPLTVGLIAIASIPLDRPDGYIQRSALGILAYMLFGVGLAHLGYIANDPGYRPVVLLLLAAPALSDVVAFTAGRFLGGRRLLPNTSPNKTVAGAVVALLVTATMVTLAAGQIWADTSMDHPLLLIGLGLVIGFAAQCGDLMLSSIKRDLGIKDMGVTLPGHGGVLDRFNSSLLVAPAAFHYIGYFVGFGLQSPTRLITG